LAKPIKEIGEHSVEIRLQGDLVASVKVVVAAEE
jgi:ribosomal protein L9